YGELPERVPIHFDIAGRPDAWSPRSFGSVLVPAFTTLLLGTGLGCLALLVARAKRAVRRADGGVSLAAQLRFRSATTALLSVLPMPVSTLLALLSATTVRVALGWTLGLSRTWIIASGAIFVVAIGGTLAIALRLGQGGARLEGAAANAPLTNGLADNACWYL